MRLLHLPVAEVAQLVRGVVGDPEELDLPGITERFARVAWSCLAEPGDGIAGAAIAELGAEPSLRVLVGVGGVDALTALWASAPSAGPPSAADLAAAVDRWSPRLRADGVTLAFRQAARFAARLLVPGDPDWPAGLGDLGVFAPHALWVRGDPALLGRLDSSVALVGARAASGYGEQVAVESAAGLVALGCAVVSGAAYGIDGAAHRSALASGGDTVAVMAGGLDRFYPAGHEALLERIVQHGAVVAEVPPGTSPTKWRFLQRNRLIAAMSAATVVVEAGWRSGSLNTAGHAAALGRPLGAVPGPVTSSASTGCHRLLREYGATCVTSAAEMAELVPAARRSTPEPPVAGGGPASSGSGPAEGSHDPDGARTRVLDALSPRSSRSIDQLARSSGLAPVRVRAELGVLELEGRAHNDGAGWTRIGVRTREAAPNEVVGGG